MMTLVVRQACTEADLAAMIELRTEAERWLAANHIRQWTDDYADYARDVLRTSLDRGIAWVIEDKNTIVATVAINGPDDDFWGWADDKDDAIYLGKMIVARRYAGRQIGVALMNWASLLAVHNGKRWMRLDCRRDNRRLQEYYQANGFTYVRTYHAPGRRTESGWLAQRAAGSLVPAEVVITKVRLDTPRVDVG